VEAKRLKRKLTSAGECFAEQDMACPSDQFEKVWRGHKGGHETKWANALKPQMELGESGKWGEGGVSGRKGRRSTTKYRGVGLKKNRRCQ